MIRALRYISFQRRDLQADGDASFNIAPESIKVLHYCEVQEILQLILAFRFKDNETTCQMSVWGNDDLVVYFNLKTNKVISFLTRNEYRDFMMDHVGKDTCMTREHMMLFFDRNYDLAMTIIAQLGIPLK